MIEVVRIKLVITMMLIVTVTAVIKIITIIAIAVIIGIVEYDNDLISNDGNDNCEAISSYVAPLATCSKTQSFCVVRWVTSSKTKTCSVVPLVTCAKTQR